MLRNKEVKLEMDDCRCIRQASLNLDNCRVNAEIMSGGERSDMAGSIKKQLLTVGTDEMGMPIQRWVYGKTMQELFENATEILNKFNPPEVVKVVEILEEKQRHCLFKSYAEKWMTLYKQETVRHTTLSEYRSVLNQHLLPAFGNYDLCEITTDKVQNFMLQKKSYAKKTIHEIVMVLGMIMEGAVEDGYIRINPARSKRLKNPSTKKMTRRILEEEEFGEVLKGLPKLSQSRDQRFLALLIYTGMRREEVLGLRWQDIDFKHRLIHVQRAITFKGNKPVVGLTKTENGIRYIPAHPALLEYLNHDEDEGNKEYVVQDHISQQIVKRMWMRISQEIDVHGTTPHCYRHMFTTMCRRAGMDEKTMQAIGGWSDIETMRNVYTHVQDQEMVNARKVLENMFKCFDESENEEDSSEEKQE